MSWAPVHVLDRYYLLITFLVTVGYQMLGFAIAWTFQFDKITDFTGGSNVLILALLTFLLGGNFYARNVLTTVCVMLWSVRLAGFLLYRVLKRGTDSRFDDIRSHFFKFFGFWIGQIVWVWTISLPIIILNSPALRYNGLHSWTASDISGTVLFFLGWSIELSADLQKLLWRSTNPPKGQPCDVGLWRWSRHPPYFGEILCWWGVWVLSIAPSLYGTLSGSAKAAQYGAVVSPLFTMILLLFGSGLPTAEIPTARKYYLMSRPSSPPRAPSPATAASSEEQLAGPKPAWESYQSYRARTSILVPLPPQLYVRLPMWVKRTVLLEWAMYEYKPDGDVEQRGEGAEE